MDTKKHDISAWIKKGKENLKKTPKSRKGSTRKTLHDRGVNAWAKWSKD